MRRSVASLSVFNYERLLSFSNILVWLYILQEDELISISLMSQVTTSDDLMMYAIEGPLFLCVLKSFHKLLCSYF